MPEFRAWDEDRKIMVYTGDYWLPFDVYRDKPDSSNCHPVVVTNEGILFCKKLPRGDNCIEIVQNGKHTTYYNDWEYSRLRRDNLILMQFTGLFDATKWEELSEKEKVKFGEFNPCIDEEMLKRTWPGRELWDRDLIKYDDGKTGLVIHTLDWNRKHDFAENFVSAFGWTDGNTMSCFCNYNRPFEFARKIGNIFENKDLLQGAQQ
jgi:hypothetical protein